MDLVVIPLLLVAGAALTFLGINGLPGTPVAQGTSSRPDPESFALPERRTVPERRIRPAVRQTADRAQLLLKSWLPRISQMPATITHTKRPTSFNDSDVLLNDVLSELMTVRQELAELRTRFEALGAQAGGAPTEEPEELPKKRARRSSTAAQEPLTRAG